MNILIHGSIMGPGGIAHHIREFSKTLNKHHKVKIRNFNLDKKTWKGFYSGPDIFKNAENLEEIHHQLLHQQSLWVDGELKEFPLLGYDESFVPDFHLIMAEAYHHYYYQDYDKPVIAYFPWETTEMLQGFIEKLQKVDYIWVPSKWQLEVFVNNGIDRNKINVVNEGVDPSKFFPVTNKKNEKLTILHIGTWEYRKSSYELIKSITNVIGDDPSVEFKLAIHDKYREQESQDKLFVKYGLPQYNNITFLDTLSEEDYINEIRNANLYVSCSRGEGWNLPLIQSLSSGVPSIYSKSTGQLEYTENSIGIGIEIVGEEDAQRKLIINNQEYFWELLHDYYPGKLSEPNYTQFEYEVMKFYTQYKLNKLSEYNNKSLLDSQYIQKNFNWDYVTEKANKILESYDTKKKSITMSNIYYLIHSSSFGDTLASTPTLRYLSQSHNEKINVVTHSKVVFRGNPYVDNLLSFDEYNLIDTSNSRIYESFTFPGTFDKNGIEKKFSHIDTRQLHANDLGFQLLPEQLSYDFYPTSLELDIDLPKEYVVLHVTTNWANRTWNDKNWTELIDWLRENKIYTVLIGSGYREKLHHSLGDTLEKYCPVFENLYGLDLTNQGTMSDMWWVINNAKCIVTMDSGPLHLAGCTNTHILQLGSAIHPSFRAPYRYGTQEYNYTYVGGTCNIFCNSNLTYNVKEWGHINAVPPMPGCLEKKSTFECHPSVDRVKENITKVLNSDNVNKFDTIIELFKKDDLNKIHFNYKVDSKLPIKMEVIDINTGLKRDNLYDVAKRNYNGTNWWAPSPGRLNGLGNIIINLYLDGEFFGYKKMIINGDNKLTIGDKEYKFENLEDNNYSTYWEIFINKDYEYDDEFNVQKNDVVLDIGGNYGFFSLYSLDKGAKKTYCVEPLKKPFNHILVLSKEFPITPINKAVSVEDGKITMTLCDDVSARNCVSTYNDLLNNTGEVITVESININTLINQIDDKIDYAKIDCEGSEYDIFKTITPDNLKKIKRYCIESHSNEILELIVSVLLKNNFNVKIKDNMIFAKNLN